MATTDNVLSDLIINDLTQEQYDALVASGEVQEGQIYATDGEGSSGGGSTTGGLESVAHDSSLEGAGTTASPLKVADTVIAQINDKADGTVVETLSSVVSENTTKLNTLRNDTDSLGDQVSGIEEKIPSSASATNQLATKADLPIGFDATVVDQLPATGEKGIIYLVPKDGEAPDVHDEYIWIDSEQKFELIGSTAVDLTDYVKNTDYATSSVGGVLKTYSLNAFSAANGLPICQTKTLEFYTNKTDGNMFIGRGTLENIKDDLVKRAVTENDITLTDEEKTAAQDWLGIKQGASLPILMAIWSDHVINDMSWLHAGTFSWQPGDDIYKAAYEHLVDDVGEVWYAWTEIGGGYCYTKTPTVSVGDTVYSYDFSVYGQVSNVLSDVRFNIGPELFHRSAENDIPAHKTDTIGDITITYYLAQDGHKICLPDQESNLVALYEKTGAADYYILDTTNKQFKLPRKHKRTLIQAVKNDDGTWYNLYSDGWVEQGGQIIRGSITFAIPMADLNYTVSGAQIRSGSTNGTYYNAYKFVNMRETGIDLDNAQSEDPLIAWSVSGYAAESAYASAGMRLEYYYVGNFTQEATEQTAGLNAELFNGKADVSRVEILEGYDYVVESQMPTASNGYTWYRKYKSGWVEQGGGYGNSAWGSNSNITFAMPMVLETIHVSITNLSVATNTPGLRNLTINGLTSTGFSTANNGNVKAWFACGMAV